MIFAFFHIIPAQSVLARGADLCVIADSREDDNVPARATRVATGDCMDATLSVDGDVDWFVTRAEAGGLVAAETYRLSGSNPDTYFELYSAQGELLVYNDDTVGAASRVEWTAHYTGDFYIKVRSFGGSRGYFDERGGGYAACCYSICFGASIESGELVAGTGETGLGRVADVSIRVANGGPIGAFRLEINYDSACLAYEGVRAGADTALWSVVAGEVVAYGRASIHGESGASAPAVNGTGELALVRFRCLEGNSSGGTPCTSTLTLANPSLDVSGCRLVPGQARCVLCLAGDLTGDGQITPRDAQWAFECSQGLLPAASCPLSLGDVCPEGGDARITREDARAILNSYVGIAPLCSRKVLP